MPADPARPRWRLLALVTGLALVTRAIGLDGGLWIDEVYSLVRSYREPYGTILTSYWGDNHHPLYAVLAHGARAVFGEHAWTVRLPAALLGAATVPCTWWVARRVADERVATWSALLLAVSYHHVWFSQNARGYTALAFFAVVATLLLLRALAAPDWRAAIAYAVVVGLGAFTHLTMVFVCVGQAAAVALLAATDPSVRRASRWRPLAASFLGAAVVTVLLYAPMLDEVIGFFTATRSGLAGISTPGWALREAIRVLSVGIGNTIPWVALVAAVAGLVVLVSGAAALWGARQRAFVLLVAGPVVAVAAGALLSRGTMYPRFFFFAIGPAIILLVAGGFAVTRVLGDRLGLGAATARALGTAGVAAVTLLSTLSLAYNYRYPKQDFDGAMAWVESHARPGDAIASAGLTADPYRMLHGRDWPVLDTAAQLDSLRSRHAATWVLYTFPRYLQAQRADLAQALRDACPDSVVHVLRGTVGDGDIRICAISRT